MTDPVRQRILRVLETLPDEKAYLVLDYIEFLESKYAARARPDNFLARLVDTVGDTMRASKVPIQTISGTLNAMDSAQKLMKGLAAAGEAVLDEVGRAVTPPGGPVAGSALPGNGARPAGTALPPAGTTPPAASPGPAGPPAGTRPPGEPPTS